MIALSQNDPISDHRACQRRYQITAGHSETNRDGNDRRHRHQNTTTTTTAAKPHVTLGCLNIQMLFQLTWTKGEIREGPNR